MAQRVLVPLNESDPASEAFEAALEEYPDGEIVALHVIDPGTASPAPGAQDAAVEELSEQHREEAEELLADARRRAEERGVTVTTDVVTGVPGDAIVEYAEEHDVDRILIGSHDRSGISKILLGSVAEDVVKGSPVSVTVVR
jgi:nucleotide-binding universal stress UspA family protein